MAETTSRQTVLVTGASSGIGRAIASRLARDGYDVVINFLNNEAGAHQTLEQVRTNGGAGRLLRFDVGDRAAAAAAIESDITAHGAYYGVVINAGVTRDAAFPMLSGEDWDVVLRTDLTGFYNVLQPAIMQMIRRRKPGRIVAIGSVSGIRGNRGQTNYSAAKAGLIGACKALGLELASRAITVNCVAPGLVQTAMTENAPISQIEALIPMGRAGTVEEVAAAVSFLIAPEAGYITRQVIAVDGGLS
jgi:3-oxoacyl-[acyl-carrier protein] reductase